MEPHWENRPLIELHLIRIYQYLLLAMIKTSSFSTSGISSNQFDTGTIQRKVVPEPPAGTGEHSSSRMRPDTNRRTLIFKDTTGHVASTGPASSSVRQVQSVNLEGSATPVTKDLNDSINRFLKRAARRLWRIRPEVLIRAERLLRPLAGKSTLTRNDLITLMEVSSCIEELRRGKNDKYVEAGHLNEQINLFIGPGAELRSRLHQFSDELERNAVVPSFSSYMQKNHPTLITVDQQSGGNKLTPEGARLYPKLKAEFDCQTQRRHVLSPYASNVSESENAIKKIIEPTYVHYQRALKEPGDSMDTRRLLVECSEIIEHLANATPEQVKKERIAATFPGGLSPADLVVGNVYKEDGFLFVGGERGDDSGFNMMVDLKKGYPVDARAYYGHPRDSDEKMQWIALPGAKFRYDGPENNNGRTTYKFTQVLRE